jgi:hypothetical protein
MSKVCCKVHRQLNMRSWLYRCLIVGFADRIFGLPPRAFNLTLHLLSNTFYLELGISSQLAGPLLCDSHNFINGTLHRIVIHKSSCSN